MGWGIEGLLAGLIDHMLGRAHEVVAHDRSHRLLDARVIHRRQHVRQPGIALSPAYRERVVTHSQPGVTAFFSVHRRSAEELRQEQKVPAFAVRHIRRKHRAQHRIQFDPRVEMIDQLAKGVFPAYQLVNGVLHRLHG